MHTEKITVERSVFFNVSKYERREYYSGERNSSVEINAIYFAQGLKTTPLHLHHRSMASDGNQQL